MRTYVLFILLTFSFYLIGFSQSNFNSLDEPVDARSISMGESFVALSNSSSGSFYNPATLNSIEGITVSFSKRYFDWLDFAHDMYYFSLNGTVHTTYGTIGLFYNRLNVGEMTIARDGPPEEVGKERIYNHTYGIGYSKEIDSHYRAGITLKTYNDVIDYTIRPAWLNTSFKTSQPYLFDFGMTYRDLAFFSSKNITDEISLGISLQNFGTDYRVNDQYKRIPHYARLGFAYSFNLMSESENKLQPFRFTFTGEYCNHLNQWKTAKSYRDYWKAGMEATFFDIVSIRMGGYAQPSTSIYAVKGSPSFRYGFGLNAPLHSMGIKTPIVVSFDFAAIPLNEIDWFSNSYAKRTLTAFSIELKYSKDLF